MLLYPIIPGASGESHDSSRATKDGVNQGDLVYGVVEGMPHSDIIEGWLVEIEAGANVVEGLLPYHLDVGIGFQICHFFNGNVFSHVYFTRTEKIGARACLRNRDDDNPIQCRTTAMIIFVTFQGETNIWLKFDDFVGTRADRMHSYLFGVVLLV